LLGHVFAFRPTVITHLYVKTVYSAKLKKVTPKIGVHLGPFYNDKFAPVDFSVPLKQKVEPTSLQFDPVHSIIIPPG